MTDELREQEEMVSKLGETPALAAETEAADELHKSLGAHRKALSDRPRLVGQCAGQLALAKSLISELRPDLDVTTAETLRLVIGRRPHIQQLAVDRKGLDERLDSAEMRHKNGMEQSHALVREASSLPPSRDPEELVVLMEEVRSRGDTEAERDKLAQVALRSITQRDASIKKLGLPASVIDQLNEIRVPSSAAIKAFERDAQGFDDDVRATKVERQHQANTARELDQKIQTLRTKKAVPTDEDLDAARSRRDRAFGLLRDQWEKRHDVTVEARELLGPGNLIDLYSGTVTAADKVADRLRSEADRVAELAQYLSDRERVGKAIEETDASSLRREKAVEELDAAWREAWKPVPCVPPHIRDARAWVEDFGRLLIQSEAVVAAKQEQQGLNAWIDKQQRRLSGAVAALEPSIKLGDTVSVMLAAAEKLRHCIEKEGRVRAEHFRKVVETEQAIRDAEAAVRKAQADMVRWQSKWNVATQGLLHGDAPQPEVALVALEGVDKILRALDEAASYETRISGIDGFAELFRAEVRALAERLGESAAVEGGREDVWVEGLHRRLAAVAQQEEKRTQALQRLERLNADASRYNTAVVASGLTLSALRSEARCEGSDDLSAIEQRSADLRSCQDELVRIEKELGRAGDGRSIAELEGEAASADKDAIEFRPNQIVEELSEGEKMVAEARDARAFAQAELRRLTAHLSASDKADELQATLARLREDVITYARLRVASTLLLRGMADYRRKNQAPLLLRASALFREITLRSFERLEADVEGDRGILVGIRPDGTSVPSDGMSEGTVDQLFFSLRLAAVEASCASGEPMPFIVDDVLVQFDDERSAAALRVLADVASRTQVALFTHHRHVLTCAQAMASSAGVFVHEL